MAYFVHLAVLANIFACLALSQSLLSGTAGLLALCQAAVFGFGAYAYALLVNVAGCHPALALLASMFAGGLAALPLAYAGERLRGDFFVIASLGLGSLYFGLFYNWQHSEHPIGSWYNLTNGAFGISDIKSATEGFFLDRLWGHLIISTVVLVLAAAAYRLAITAPWGRIVMAIRDDRLAAEGLGRRTILWSQELALASGAVAGVAGGMYASFIGFVDPTLATTEQSVLFFAMAALGGMRSLSGALGGAWLLVLFPEALRFLSVPQHVASDARLLAYGLLLVGLTHLRPQGVLAGKPP